MLIFFCFKGFIHMGKNSFFSFIFVILLLSCNQTGGLDANSEEDIIVEIRENIEPPTFQEVTFTIGDYIGTHMITSRETSMVTGDGEVMGFSYYPNVDDYPDYWFSIYTLYSDDYVIESFSFSVLDENDELLFISNLYGIITYDTDSTYAYLDFYGEGIKGTAYVNTEGINFPNN
jgi:hypothetical protein